MPNGTFANNNLVNVTAADCRRLDIQIGISYTSDLKCAKKALEEVLDADPKIMSEKEKWL